MKPTKAQFKEYVAIRDSGVTNMFDTGFITDISVEGLTRDMCLYIMKHFHELAEEYDVNV